MGLEHIVMAWIPLALLMSQNLERMSGLRSSTASFMMLQREEQTGV